MAFVGTIIMPNHLSLSEIVFMTPIFFNFKKITDPRGQLIAIEQDNDIPFNIKRIYYIQNTPDNVRRGLHAHKELKQVAICLKGACKFLLDNGSERLTLT